MFLPAELFTKKDLGKPETTTPEDFLTDQEEETPKQSKEKGTGERREARVGHKRGRKLKKVSAVPPSAEVRRATLPRLSEAGQLVLLMALANSSSALSGNSL